MALTATERQSRYRKKHPGRIRAARKKWRRKNIERELTRERNYIENVKPHLRRKFGITFDEYAAKLKEQNGSCAICGSKSIGKKGQKLFNVDHDHTTNKIRGLLCHHCNTGLGHFKNSLDLLDAAKRYLTGIEVVPSYN
jgi:hypothetical protein